MNFKIIQPSQQLADYVRLFWFLEYSASKETQFVHHSFAHHCSEIVFCYKGQGWLDVGAMDILSLSTLSGQDKHSLSQTQ